MHARSASYRASLTSAIKRSSSPVGTSTSIDFLERALRTDLNLSYRYILDLQQRASSNQPSAGTAEYVTPGSLDTNINVGGSSDQGTMVRN